ncbi:MAG: YceD family protein [Acetobacteraceae bacterium]
MTGDLSCVLPLHRIPPAGASVTIQATPAELAALAERLDLPAIAALEGRFQLHPAPGGIVAATLTLTAEVTAVSVVSLEPFPRTVRETAALRFVPAGEEEQDDLIDPESPDDIPYSGTGLALGEAVAEQLALALDPYPRKPGETLSVPSAGPEPDHAFAALARLQRGQKKS